jgi:hypothetical protein
LGLHNDHACDLIDAPDWLGNHGPLTIIFVRSAFWDFAFCHPRYLSTFLLVVVYDDDGGDNDIDIEDYDEINDDDGNDAAKLATDPVSTPSAKRRSVTFSFIHAI